MAATRKYPAEVQERAVAMVRELEKELGHGRGATARPRPGRSDTTPD